MPWSSSDRRSRLPGDWARRRRLVIARDGGLCPCGDPGTEVDHIEPGDDHDLENLQLLCHRCHLRKTLAEAKAADVRILASRRRPPEPHPGERARKPGG